jgi:hypothetical protein
MKKCSPSLAIKEIKIKTTLRFHFTWVRMSIFKGKKTTNVGKDAAKQKSLYIIVKWKLAQPLWKAVWRFFKKLKIELPYDPVIPLLIIDPKEHKSGYNRDTCTLMFITVLFTMAKLWKQPRCPTTDKCIKKMWYVYKTEFYPAIKPCGLKVNGCNWRTSC